MCGSGMHRDELGAKMRLAQVQRARDAKATRRQHDERKVYQCPKCRRWGITSKTDKRDR